MRVAISINTSWNIYNFRKGLIRALMDAGHDVIAISPEDDYVERLKDWGCQHLPIDMHATGLNPVHEWRIYRQYLRLLKEHKVQILLTYTIKPNVYGTLAARRLQIPTISNISGLGTSFLWSGFSTTFIRQLYRFAAKRADHVFFQNPQDRDEFNRVVGLPENRTSVLPGSGINLSEITASKPPLGRERIFLMVARVIQEKGIMEFAQAAEKTRERIATCRFRLIGRHDPTHRRAIDRRTLDAWIEKGILEYQSHSDRVLHEMQQADVIVLPSYREGMSRTLLEGAACGRPLIATDVPGCRDLVQPGHNGLLCLPRDSDSLATCFYEMIKMTDDQLYDMGQASRKLVELSFDEQLVIERYREKMNELVEQYK